jgi:rhamnosyltransferase subunit B
LQYRPVGVPCDEELIQAAGLRWISGGGLVRQYQSANSSHKTDVPIRALCRSRAQLASVRLDPDLDPDSCVPDPEIRDIRRDRHLTVTYRAFVGALRFAETVYVGEIVIATLGSWGDLFPMVGLAKGLTDAGHTVTIAASPSEQTLIEDEGLAFAPMGPAVGFADYAADPKILDGRLGGYVGFLHLFRTLIFPNLARYVDDLVSASKSADVLLAHPALIAAPIAAEATGIRWGSLSVFPGLIPTALAPATPSRLPSPPGALGRAANRLSWSVGRINVARSFDAPINAERARLGLPAMRNAFFAPADSGNPYLILASPTVVQRLSDWPESVRLTGFVRWSHPQSWSVPDGLRAFLSGEPPVLITLGASSSLDPGRFYQDAVAATLASGQRALVLTGPTPEPVRLKDDQRVFSAPFVPLALVAGDCRAAINHGGVGTSVECLAAGLPQLIVPRGFDQPQTAIRLSRLGVAHTLPWKKANARTIQREVEILLRDGAIAERSAAIAVELGDEDGLRQAVAAVTAIAS